MTRSVLGSTPIDTHIDHHNTALKTRTDRQASIKPDRPGRIVDRYAFAGHRCEHLLAHDLVTPPARLYQLLLDLEQTLALELAFV